MRFAARALSNMDALASYLWACAPCGSTRPDSPLHRRIEKAENWGRRRFDLRPSRRSSSFALILVMEVLRPPVNQRWLPRERQRHGRRPHHLPRRWPASYGQGRDTGKPSPGRRRSLFSFCCKFRGAGFDCTLRFELKVPALRTARERDSVCELGASGKPPSGPTRRAVVADMGRRHLGATLHPVRGARTAMVPVYR